MSTWTGLLLRGIVVALGVGFSAAAAETAQQLPGCADPRARAQLAPTGTLRLGFTSVPLWAVRDAANGRLRGLAVTLGEALAAQLDAPFAPVTAPNLPQLVAAGPGTAWDVAISVIAPAHRATLDYSPPVMLDEATFLVPAASDIRSVADADRAGTRIAVVKNNPTDTFLKDTIRNATLLRADSPQAALDLVASGQAEVMALARWNVPGRLKALPAHRALDENFAAQPVAFSIPKGEPEAMSCLEQFVRDALASGRMAEAIAASGLVGIAPPPAR